MRLKLSECQVNSRVLNAVSELVKLLMPPDPVHGIEHVERVVRMACRIASNYETVDREVLLLSAYLHDIGRLSSPDNHAVRSASIVRHILEMLGYPKDKIEKVVDTVLSHSYSLGY
ncbi:MAG: HD domain-containing protein, partial [Sulfolobales archaeon]